MREKRRTKRRRKRKVMDDMCRHYLTPPPFISERCYLFTKIYKQQKEKNTRDSTQTEIDGRNIFGNKTKEGRSRRETREIT
jgi:hypothetical protein